MRIAFFHNLPPGGAKRVAYYQVKYLSQKHEVDLYTLKSQDPDFLNFSELKCNIYEYEFDQGKRAGPFNRVLSDIKVLSKLRNLHKKIALDIDKKKYDIVVAHPDKYTQAPFVLSFLKTRKSYYCHELLRLAYEEHLMNFKPKTPAHLLYEKMTRSIRKKIDKDNALHSDIIVTNSAFTALNVEKYYGRRAAVCYPGVDTDIFKKRNYKKIYDLLFVGDKVQEDGFDLLQSIVKLLPRKIKVNIISTRQNGKWISDSELSNEYNKAKIVLALAVNEPLGLIPLESMACGVPVIAAAEGGYKETVVNGKTGFLMSRSPKKISLKIESILSNPNLQKKLRQNSVDYIKNVWSWEKRMKHMINVLET